MTATNKPGGLEMTTFKLEKGKTYLDFIAADVDHWLKKQPGFRFRHIAQRTDGTIIDALIWDSEEDGTDAMHLLMTELADSPVHAIIDQGTGLHSVQQVADYLKVSPRYLNDMLRSLTGQTTQQHIHNKLIEKAKNILSTGNLTIAEIAYGLGFEYPHSFNKLFKAKVKVSPLEFRQSFN